VLGPVGRVGRVEEGAGDALGAGEALGAGVVAGVFVGTDAGVGAVVSQSPGQKQIWRTPSEFDTTILALSTPSMSMSSVWIALSPKPLIGRIRIPLVVEISK
jgi:hypothetical protein